MFICVDSQMTDSPQYLYVPGSSGESQLFRDLITASNCPNKKRDRQP